MIRACPWTLAEVAAATGGALAPSVAAAQAAAIDPALRVAGISTDTRDALAGHLFVALVGERFDAHEFLGLAEQRGAAALLVSEAGLSRARQGGWLGSGVPLVVVKDTLRALGDLAAAHHRRLGTIVLALTGSNGKTTTKEMIAGILARSRAVLKTEGNLNNLIGVPMTLFGLTREHAVAVVEMGMNQRGEIARYCEIAEPQVGLVLNVGPAHIGNLGSLSAIGDAKGELYFGLDPGRGLAVVNADDLEVLRVAAASGVARRRTFGRSPSADVVLVEYAARASAQGATGFARYQVDGRPLEVELPVAGEHNAMNAAGAIAAVTAPELAPFTFDEIREGLQSAGYASRRMAFDRVGPFVVVDDCYNANRASMIAAIQTVSAFAAASGARFVALLGEIREVGAFSEEEHAKVGDAVVAARPALVAAFGAAARPIADRATAAQIQVHHEAEDVDAMWSWLRPRLERGDVILVKGSRGMAMERFIELMRREAV